MAKQYGCLFSDLNEIKLFFDDLFINLLKSNSKSDQINDVKKILERLKKIELLDFHYNISRRQRDSYNRLKQNVPDDTVFLELDFKERIKIGLSPEQISQEFYRLKSRYVLGNMYNLIKRTVKGRRMKKKCEKIIPIFVRMF